MYKSLILIAFIFCLFSCENNQKYSGTFKTLDKKTPWKEISIHYLKDNKYNISFLQGLIDFEGRRKGNRITAKPVKDPAFGNLEDNTVLFLDYNSDANQITLTTSDQNSMEVYFRIR